jgi:hypothetical protein
VPGGRSASLGRTVRGHRADGPLPTCEQSFNRNRTTRHAPGNADGPYLVLGRSASNWWRADSPRSPGGQSGPHADGPVPLHGRSDKAPAAKLWHLERSTCELTRTGRTREELAPRGQSAGYGRTVRQPSNRTTQGENREVNVPYPTIDLPNGLRSRLKVWGRCEASLGDAAPKLGSPNELNRRESNRHRTQPKT